MGVGRLRREEKVSMVVDMSDAMVGVCADGIRARYPRISEEELLEKLRERIDWVKRWRRRGGGL